MIHRKEGCIINISSVWGIVGASCETVYSASKAGINGLTKALAKELGPSNIRVNAIAPGFIQTDMTKDLKLDGVEEHIPLRRLGLPEDIAKAVKFLALDADYITGQVIEVDGGLII